MDNSDRWVEKYGESFMDFPLKGLKFKKTAWTKKNNHTHCLFCGDEITDEEYNYHTEKQGYASTTKFWWSCPECFEVFTQKYNLPVVKNTVKGNISIEKTKMEKDTWGIADVGKLLCPYDTCYHVYGVLFPKADVCSQ